LIKRNPFGILLSGLNYLSVMLLHSLTGTSAPEDASTFRMPCEIEYCVASELTYALIVSFVANVCVYVKLTENPCGSYAIGTV